MLKSKGKKKLRKIHKKIAENKKKKKIMHFRKIDKKIAEAK